MGLASQIWTLTVKNLLIVFARRWFSTTIRAFILPIVFMFFISYAKNFFVPPAVYGIGSASPLMSLTEALQADHAARNTVAFNNNGFTGGDIETVITSLADTVRAAGRNVEIISNSANLSTVCPSSLNGVSGCFAAAEFWSSTTEGPGGTWNYTVRCDGALGEKLFANSDQNDAQIYIMPFQNAVDRAIISTLGGTLPDTIEQYPYTSETQAQRARNITRLYQGTVISIIAVAFFIGMVGVTYQLVGHMAMERELGMSQLIEAMMPNKHRWTTQVARLAALHLSFDILYLPSWIINGIIVSYLVFPQANVGLVIGLHLLGGFALSSWSMLFGAFFRKAQLSGITTTIVSLVLAIVAQIPLGAHGSTGSVIVLSLLFTPMNYVFFLIWIAGFQQRTRAADLLKHSPGIDWKISGIVFWIFLIIQIIVFPLLAAWVERSLYGTASKSRKMDHDASSDSIAVKLDGFSKHYGSSWFKQKILCCGRRKYKNVVKAVNDLTLNIHQGQIMILLGANGSGKSTTLDAIAGLNTITQGSIEIDGRGGLGLCPQKNVLWDDLTVYEHVMIFNKLKTTETRDSKAQTQELVKACDLQVKLGARAKTLSGGQKRKLQLAMMFTGGSRVCCVDEVSSGIDPLARRKVWDILLNERGRRTILLTTHFLDEADVLSDHIAILSKGHLKAQGTAVELKHKLGGGYRVFVDRHVQYTPGPGLQDVSSTTDYDLTVYHPANSHETATLIADLERAGITDYRVQGPTVEDVFLNLADEIKDQFNTPAPQALELIEPKGHALEDDVSTASPVKNGTLDLLPGHGTSLFRQSWILFRKRFTVLRRNYLPHCAAIIIPVIAAGLVTLFLKGFSPLTCVPQPQSDNIESLISGITIDLPYGPPEPQLISYVASKYPAINASSVHAVSSVQNLDNFVSANYSQVTPGGVWFGDDPTYAWLMSYAVETSSIVINIVDQLLSRHIINTNYQPFDTPWAPGAGDTIQLILYFGLAMSAYPGLFALYPTAERLRKVRALHYSNGIRSLPIWAAYTAFDFLFVILISILAIALFVGLWYGWYYPGYLFLVFLLYGLTSIAYSYVISLFTTSQLATFAFASGSQCVLFLIYFIAYLSIITYAPVNETNHYITIAHFTIALITPSGNLARALLLTLNEFSLLCQGTRMEASYPGGILVYGGPILYLIIQFVLLMTFLVWYDSGGRIKLPRRSAARPEDVEETMAEKSGDVQEELSRVQSSNDGLRVMNITKTFGTNTAVDNVTFGVRKSEVFALLGPNGAGKSTTISLIRGDLRPSGRRGDIFVEGIALSQHRVAARNHLGVCPQFDAMDAMTVREHLAFYARVRGVPDVEHNVSTVMNAVGLNTYANRMALKLSGGNKRKLSLAIALMGNPSVLLLDEPSSGMDAAAKRVMWRVLASVTGGRALLITTHSMEEADALANRAGILARSMLALGTSDDLRARHGDAWHVHIVHREAPHTSADEMARVKAWVDANVPGAVTEDRTYHGQLRFSVPNAPVPAASSTGSSSPVASSTSDTAIEPAKDGVVRTRTVPARGRSIAALFALLEENKDELAFAYYSVAPTTLDQVFLNVVNKHNVEEENYSAKTKSVGNKGLARLWPRRGKAV